MTKNKHDLHSCGRAGASQSRKRRDFRKGGFTLLEMVAAMVLMTILFAALTSLLRSFSDQEKTLQRIVEAHPPTQQLTELLRRDLINARFVRGDRLHLTLVGNMAQDWATRTPTGQRAEVTYRIDTIGGEPWLVRREVHLSATSTQRVREELIWQGATAIEFVGTRRLEVDAAEETSETLPLGMEAAPARVQLTIRGIGGKPLIDLNLLHHWEDS